MNIFFNSLFFFFFERGLFVFGVFESKLLIFDFGATKVNALENDTKPMKWRPCARILIFEFFFS